MLKIQDFEQIDQNGTVQYSDGPWDNFWYFTILFRKLNICETQST